MSITGHLICPMCAVSAPFVTLSCDCVVRGAPCTALLSPRTQWLVLFAAAALSCWLGRYSLRVIAKDQAPSAAVEFSTIDGFGWDADASTQGGKIRITNNSRTVTSSGGSAASLANVGFSRGRVTISLVVEVSKGARCVRVRAGLACWCVAVCWSPHSPPPLCVSPSRVCAPWILPLPDVCVRGFCVTRGWCVALGSERRAAQPQCVLRCVHEAPVGPLLRLVLQPVCPAHPDRQDVQVCNA